MSDPLVSICCLAFNHQDYVRDCLAGFIMQKSAFPFEILIYDDASSNNTTEILLQYAEQHPDLIIPIFQTGNQYSQGVKL
jgi:glycosyltransferase involved in cell wall biosynthesis